jgi:tetratricopeptide (TPR) repeat protein
MFQYLKNILIIISLFIPLSIYCQHQANTGQIGNEKIAKKYFEYQDFKDALNEYLLLLKTDSSNTEYNYQIGMCYLLTNIDKKKAIPYLEKVTKQPDVNIFIWYTLGRAYQLAYRFDDAINSFKKFKKLLEQGYDDNYITSNRQIQMCYNAKKMIKNPVNVTFENLGSKFNSSYPDYYPFVPKDESFIIFTSKRKGNIGGLLDYDGFYTSDIYISEFKNCNWKNPKSINTVNSELVEECIGLSQNGENLLIFADNYIATSEVLSAKKRGKNFQRPVTLGKYLKSYMITSASVTNDNNILFFKCPKNVHL